MDKTPRTDALKIPSEALLLLGNKGVPERITKAILMLGDHARQLETELSAANAQLAEAQRYRSWEFIEKALAMEQARMDKVAGLFPQTAEEHRKSRIAMHDVLGTVRWAKSNKMPLPVLDAMDQTEQKGTS